MLGKTNHDHGIKCQRATPVAWQIRASAIVGIVIGATSSVPATAKEVCVTCEQPKMNYRCRVPAIDIGRATDAAASYLCVTALAKSGGHSTCEIQRMPKEFSCLGQVRVLDPKGKILDQKGEPVESTGKGDVADPATAPATDDIANPDNDVDNATIIDAPDAPKPDEKQPKEKGPPKTVEELARNTAEQSKNGLSKAGETIKNAGNAVGNAAKKTWNCVASLFSDC